MRRVLPGFLLVVLAAGAATEPTPSELLTLIRNRMSGTLAALPNYTCRETIERKVRKAKTRKITTTDLLRLDVAYLDHNETFAWPWSRQFGDERIGDLVPSGVIASGNFGSQAREIFSSPAVIFNFVGESSVDQRREVEFRFRMPLESSGFVIRHGPQSGVVAYHGFFSADPNTGDLIGLEVSPDSIPSDLDVAQARQETEYARVRIRDADYLLPASSELTVLDSRGDSYRNHITFANCREYRGESTVTFGDAGDLPGTTPSPDSSKVLPAGLVLRMKTTAPIRRGVTAIGDTVPAVITEAVDGLIDLPKGAVATMRVIRMDSELVGKTYSHVLRLQLLGVETGGQKYDAAGVLLNVQGSQHFVSSGDGRLFFTSQELLVRPGLILMWQTAEPH
jgi:hypothetical protein